MYSCFQTLLTADLPAILQLGMTLEGSCGSLILLTDSKEI